VTGTFHCIVVEKKAASTIKRAASNTVSTYCHFLQNNNKSIWNGIKKRQEFVVAIYYYCDIPTKIRSEKRQYTSTSTILAPQFDHGMWWWWWWYVKQIGGFLLA
jgi:hypothetical protein